MKRGTLTRLAVVGGAALALAAATGGLMDVRQSPESRLLKAGADAIVSKKEVETVKAGKNAEAAVGAENRGPNSSPEIEAYLLRAYPGTEIPIEATIGAQNGW